MAALGDDERLARLVARNANALLSASKLLTVRRTQKQSKKRSSKARGAQRETPDNLGVVEGSTPRLVGYARVSTDEQTTALQLDALRSAECAVIHEDSASGAARSRPGLVRAIEDVAAGDTLVVWRLDRLGRSLRDLLEIAETLRERHVSLRSLTDHIDTGTAAGRMLYAVLGAVAQFERDVLREAPSQAWLPPRSVVRNSAGDRRSRRRKYTRRRRC